MNRLEFYKDLFEKEEIRKTELNSTITIPIGVVSAIVTVFSYFLISFNYDCIKVLSISFLILSFLGITALLIALCYTIKSYNNFFSGYRYHKIPFAIELLKKRY
jgi:uncharacterized Tic20 family protein